MRPIKYAIYKGMGGKFGAVQFSLAAPVFVCEVCKHRNYMVPEHDGNSTCSGDMPVREGAVFVDVANTTAPNIYDWEHKTIFAMSVTDMGKILSGLRAGTEVKLLHDPGAQTEKQGQVTKTLSFGAQTDRGCLFNMYEKNKSGEEKKFMIPLTPDEVTVIGTLIARAIPLVLAW
jgi:hypothetical protein